MPVNMKQVKTFILICKECGKAAPRRCAMQKYCTECSEVKDLERKKIWARNHPLDETRIERRIANCKMRKERSKEAGAELNKGLVNTIAWHVQMPDLVWYARIKVPFTYAASKNHIYSLNPRGHVAMRKESAAFRDEISFKTRLVLDGIKVAHNKVWLDILVQKPNHKGDAINVVDLVCDGVKRAMPVDDRWFCIRHLDWQISKNDPMLFVGMGQESFDDCQACSYCGQIKLLECFGKRSGSHLGIYRVCRECMKLGRKKL